MKKIFFIFKMIILLGNTLHSQQPDGTIYFDNRKAALNRESKTKLKVLVENIQKNKSPQVMISGFTDVNGSIESNLALSKKRALAVSDYFTANGIEKNKITVQFFGEDRPVSKSEKNLRENRRVEIRIEALKKKDEKISPGIFGKLWKAPVKHIFSATKITSNEDLVVDGPEGTKIWIAANSLCRPNGEPARGDVDLELTEYYKKSEMLLANLYNSSDSAMLDLRGVINVVARSGGERLSLKKGSEMGIEFQVSKKEQELGVFVGAQHGNQMTWKRQPDDGIAARERPAWFAGSYQGVEKTSKDYLVVGSGSLGWISCGRLSTVENKTSLSVEIDPMYHPTVRLVFKGFNAILSFYKDVNGSFKVTDIPVGQKATLVVFGMVKETPYFISKDIVISDNQVEKLVPKPTTVEALRTIVKKVN